MNKSVKFNDICPHIQNAVSSVTHRDYGPVEWKAYFYVLYYILEGTGKMIADGKEYNMKKNSLILLKPGIPFELSALNCDVKWITATFNYTCEICINTNDYPSHCVTTKNFDPQKITELVTFDDCKFFNDIIHIQSIPGIKDYLLKCVYEQSMKRVSYEDMTDTLFHHTLIVIRRVLTEASAVKSASTNHIDAILDYIHKNYDKHLTNKKIGEIFYLHPNYINKLMVIYTNQSLHQYLLGVRISNAKKLFASSDMKISEVAENVGFHDLSLFSKNFKKIVGKSPRQFLKMIK